MSLSLLQGYSSAEEEPAPHQLEFSSSSDDDAAQRNVSRLPTSSSFNPALAAAQSSSYGGSHLPSAFDAFSQISSPPQFLKSSAEEQSSINVRDGAAFRGRRKSKVNKNMPSGAVVEAKAQLVSIHERVRSDIEGRAPLSSSDDTKKGSSATSPEGSKRVLSASNPGLKDATELLRMCLQCGVPKTYSNARGIVCPECGDRPPSDEAPKKKGSTVKDKEKIKRMRGQSSHASWKSETEMQLRQHFD